MSVRIVQFGEGVFLRGFFDWMVERLQREAGTDIKVTLVQPRNSQGVTKLMEQGGQFTVVQSGLEAGVARSEQLLVQCIDQGINTHSDPEAFERLAADPDVRVVVSNTTEAGIAWSESDAELHVDRSLVRSFPGKLTWFLAERFERLPESDSIYILPCELIAENGRLLNSFVRRMAQAWGLGDDFQNWLDTHVVFFDTLVDRIVPGRPSEQIEFPQGGLDQFAVQVEWFHSWYLQGPRDLLDVLPLNSIALNVHFVDDLEPYRDLKVRVLNGTHSTMASIGVALGLESVAEAMGHTQFGPWLEKLVEDEVLPTLEVPAEEASNFVAATWDRFRNPYIEHRLRSILLNASAKIPSRLGDTVQERAEQGSSCPRIAAGVAAWLWLTRDQDLDDDREVLKRLKTLWASGDPAVVAKHALQDAGILGAVEWPDAFVAEVLVCLEKIDACGPEALLCEHVSSTRNA